MSLSGNFAQDFIIALGVAAAVTVVFLTLVCVLAQCGPRMFGRVDKKERWFDPALEEGQSEKGLPFVQGGSHPNSTPNTNSNTNSNSNPNELAHEKEFA